MKKLFVLINFSVFALGCIVSNAVDSKLIEANKGNVSDVKSERKICSEKDLVVSISSALMGLNSAPRQEQLEEYIRIVWTDIQERKLRIGKYECYVSEYYHQLEIIKAERNLQVAVGYYERLYPEDGKKLRFALYQAEKLLYVKKWDKACLNFYLKYYGHVIIPLVGVTSGIAAYYIIKYLLPKKNNKANLTA